MRYRSEPGFEQRLQATPEFQAAMVGITSVVGAAVKAAALPYKNTGYYLRHIAVRGTTIAFEDWGWHFSEYGSIHNPPQRNAYRGIKAAGLRFQDPRSPS